MSYHQGMSLRLLALASLLLLPSCSLFTATEEYTPEYLKEDSPLDPPGTAQARKALRDKYAELAKNSTFKPGETYNINDGRVYLLDRNPDNVNEPSGRMVKAETAKVISCEGLYYFVETEGGKRGYLRASDLVSPVQLVPTDPLLMNGDLFPAGLPEGETPGPVGDIPLNDNQKLTTNADGRTVIIVDKKTDRSAEFEAQKQAMEQGAQLNNSGSEGGDPPPLPDSSLGN